MFANTIQSSASCQPHRLLLVAPSPPPYGGMALQARLLERLLGQDGNAAAFFPSNFAFPKGLRFLDRFRGVRTLGRMAMIWALLWKPVRQAEIVHVLAASWLYFFIVVCPAVILGRLCRKKVVLNYRGGEAKRFFDRWGWLAAPIFQLADTITAPSEFLAGVIRDRFHIPVLIVPNIVDSARFTYRKRTPLQPRMVVTRHLEKIYDIESVLRAFQVVQQRYPEASLWIAGTGTEQQRLRGLVTAWKLRNVRFLGHIPHSELPGVYDQCDILLNASRVDNFPGALVEASAAGLVVVSTNAGGIPFIYQHGKNALLTDPGNWKGLAQAVESLLQNPSLAARLAAEGAVVARKSDWAEVRKALYAAYGFPPVGSKEEPLLVTPDQGPGYGSPNWAGGGL